MNAKELGAMPASPQLHMIDGNWNRDPLHQYAGLTLRQHFAGLAMQAYIASGVIFCDSQPLERADALLAELAKDQP